MTTTDNMTTPARAPGTVPALVRLSLLATELHAAMQHGVTCFYMPYMGRFNQTPYYIRSDTHKRCTKQAEALLKAGLVETYNHDWRGHSLRVTPNAEAHGRRSRTVQPLVGHSELEGGRE